MLSDERIRELALTAVPPYHWTKFVDKAIRLAVAETAEACAGLCAEHARKYSDVGDYHEENACETLAAAIREKAREGK